MPHITPVLGFTGTRGQPTDKQLEWLFEQVRLFIQDAGCLAELHHGACVGADKAAHDAALDNGLNVVIHPPTDQKLMMDLEPWRDDMRVTILHPMPYHVRNREIVHASSRMLALPNSTMRPHSGTWYTIDYALASVPVSICYPDGTTETRVGAR